MAENKANKPPTADEINGILGKRYLEMMTDEEIRKVAFYCIEVMVPSLEAWTEFRKKVIVATMDSKDFVDCIRQLYFANNQFEEDMQTIPRPE